MPQERFTEEDRELVRLYRTYGDEFTGQLSEIGVGRLKQALVNAELERVEAAGPASERGELNLNPLTALTNFGSGLYEMAKGGAQLATGLYPFKRGGFGPVDTLRQVGSGIAEHSRQGFNRAGELMERRAPELQEAIGNPLLTGPSVVLGGPQQLLSRLSPAARRDIGEAGGQAVDAATGGLLSSPAAIESIAQGDIQGGLGRMAAEIGTPYAGSALRAVRPSAFRGVKTEAFRAIGEGGAAAPIPAAGTVEEAARSGMLLHRGQQFGSRFVNNLADLLDKLTITRPISQAFRRRQAATVLNQVEGVLGLRGASAVDPVDFARGAKEEVGRILSGKPRTGEAGVADVGIVSTSPSTVEFAPGSVAPSVGRDFAERVGPIRAGQQVELRPVPAVETLPGGTPTLDSQAYNRALRNPPFNRFGRNQPVPESLLRGTREMHTRPARLTQEGVSESRRVLNQRRLRKAEVAEAEGARQRIVDTINNIPDETFGSSLLQRLHIDDATFLLEQLDELNPALASELRARWAFQHARTGLGRGAPLAEGAEAISREFQGVGPIRADTPPMHQLKASDIRKMVDRLGKEQVRPRADRILGREAVEQLEDLAGMLENLEKLGAETPKLWAASLNIAMATAPIQLFASPIAAIATGVALPVASLIAAATLFRPEGFVRWRRFLGSVASGNTQRGVLAANRLIELLTPAEQEAVRRELEEATGQQQGPVQ